MPSFDPRTTAAHPHPDIPPFPSPQTFDILPEIYTLISRLQLPTNPTTITNASPAPGQTTSSTTSQLSPKDLPTAAIPIKQKIAKARAAVQVLPDVGRTVAQQEEEVRMLEERCRRLRGRVGELGRLAAMGTGRKVEESEVKMEGNVERDEVMESV